MNNLNKKNGSQRFTGDELKLKTAGVCYSIAVLTEEITRGMLKRVTDFEKLDKSSQDKLSFVICYFLLQEAKSG